MPARIDGRALGMYTCRIIARCESSRFSPTLVRLAHCGEPGSFVRRDGTELCNWDTDEPSERSIDGIERLRLIRDDVDARVRTLLDERASAPRTPRRPNDREVQATTA